MSNLQERQKPALKNAITQILSCALQPQSNIQRLTEERKKALEMTEEYPFILLEIVQSREEAFAEKMMAATFLKNYVIDSYGTKGFIAPTHSMREKLSLILVECLSTESDVIREMLSSALEILVIKEYPNLFNVINNRVMSYLLSENMLEVTGAIHFMKNLGRNKRDFCNQNMYFSPEYIEPLLNILLNEIFSMDQRCATMSCLVQILVNCRTTDLFQPTQARITEVLKKLLSDPYSHHNGFRLRYEIVKEISNVVARLPEDNLQLVSQCLPAIGQIMFNCSLECKEVIMGQKEVPRDPGEEEPANFNQLMINILSLINDVFLIPCYTSLLSTCLNDFMYLLFVLMCSMDPPDQQMFYTETELDEYHLVDYSLRGHCTRTLVIFMDRTDFVRFTSALHHVLQKHMSEANIARTTSQTYYNKILESLMHGIGLLSYMFEDVEANFLYYVEHWSNLLVEESPHWMVLARLLWLGSKFSLSLAPMTLNHHLTAILTNYTAQNYALRLACFDALRTHLATLKSSPNRMIFSNLMTDINECLFLIPVCTPSLSTLCLKSLGYFFEFTPETAARSAQRMINVLLDSLMLNMSNTTVVMEVKFLVSKVVSIVNCKEAIKNIIIPFAIKLVYKNYEPPSSAKADTPEIGLDLLNTIIKFYPDPWDDDTVTQTFLAAYSCIVPNDDNGIVEIATIFISNILIKSAFQLKTLTDSKGKRLAEYLPDLLFKLLHPCPQESVCPSKFGRLCVISILTMPEHLQPCIEAILKALLSALQRTDTSEPIRSYCFIFAYMFVWQTESTVAFLSGIPGPDGRSALSYFLNKWRFEMLMCDNFERKIMTLAVCKMIEFSLANNDDRINECRIGLGPPYGGESTGLEKLYLCLIQLLINEPQMLNKFSYRLENSSDLDNIDPLVENHPVCKLNVINHIKTFLVSYNTIHYYNVVKKYVKRSKHEFDELIKYGVKPSNL